MHLLREKGNALHELFYKNKETVASKMEADCTPVIPQPAHQPHFRAAGGRMGEVLQERERRPGLLQPSEEMPRVGATTPPVSLEAKVHQEMIPSGLTESRPFWNHLKMNF